MRSCVRVLTCGFQFAIFSLTMKHKQVNAGVGSGMESIDVVKAYEFNANLRSRPAQLQSEKNGLPSPPRAHCGWC